MADGRTEESLQEQHKEHEAKRCRAKASFCAPCPWAFGWVSACARTRKEKGNEHVRRVVVRLRTALCVGMHGLGILLGGSTQLLSSLDSPTIADVFSQGRPAHTTHNTSRTHNTHRRNGFTRTTSSGACLGWRGDGEQARLLSLYWRRRTGAKHTAAAFYQASDEASSSRQPYLCSPQDPSR